MSADRDARRELERRVTAHLETIYPDADIAALTTRLIDLLEAPRLTIPEAQKNKWDESDVLLITYGNSIVRRGQRPLQTLHEFIERQLAGTFRNVHILPFFPYSSDDGFAVLNYLQVNSALGEWKDIERIGAEYRLMADLVINHASGRSHWFENFRNGRDPGSDYFVTVPPGTDVTQVVRPRSTPLLREVETAQGTRLVWCTFGPDQVDLDFSNPAVLCEFASIMARYLDAGVRILRLDAVAFLWKEPGTPCIHLRQTHEIVKLLRNLAEFKCPGAMIITETNVPNRDNLTYFGNANEAHAIYNFSLPPLLIHTLLSGDCRHLKTWMMRMPPAQQGTCYLNFLASHDGVGLRPAEGLLKSGELDALISTLELFGGHTAMRSDRKGSQRPYEANITLWNALAGTIRNGPDDLQFERYLCAHAIMCGLEGIPAIYLQSLFGTRNDHTAVQGTGRYRSINRHVWRASRLEEELARRNGRTSRVFQAMLRLLRIRRRQPAFHPNAVQFTMHLGTSIFGFWRQSTDRRQSIFCLSNVTDKPQTLNLSDINLIDTEDWTDLLGTGPVSSRRGRIKMDPYQTFWLTNR